MAGRKGAGVCSAEWRCRMQENAVQGRICTVQCSPKSLGFNALILASADGSFVKCCELCPADIRQGCAPASHES